MAPSCTTSDGVTVAMRVAGLDRPKMLEQWFRMGEATTLEQFKDALRMMSVPMWHANYADDNGHIMFVFDGLVPRRNGARLRVLVGRRARRHVGDAVDRLPVVRRAAEVDRSRRAAGTRTRTSRRGTTLPLLDRTKYRAVRRADRRGAAADADAPFAAHDHRGFEDQLRAAASRRSIRRGWSLPTRCCPIC